MRTEDSELQMTLRTVKLEVSDFREQLGQRKVC